MGNDALPKDLWICISQSAQLYCCNFRRQLRYSTQGINVGDCACLSKSHLSELQGPKTRVVTYLLRILVFCGESSWTVVQSQLDSLS
ncbi:hypothetical protein GDO81_024713 [Engystomops pustulosus]|uniref:Uncharacterized protein n=1 Tax=Engystomops pustulosus TaxID=76066 RepID=A0AAV6YTG2_ENGPU|nr:hypothetical protein GDO81_024713 [Engystomops pustulosus]